MCEIENLFKEIDIDTRLPKNRKLIEYLRESGINKEALLYIKPHHFEKFFAKHDISIGHRVLIRQKIYKWQKLQKNLNYPDNLSKMRTRSLKPRTKKDDEDLLEWLKLWGLEVLYEKCLEEEITVEELSVMTPRHCELLTKDFKLGVLIRLEYHIRSLANN